MGQIKITTTGLEIFSGTGSRWTHSTTVTTPATSAILKPDSAGWALVARIPGQTRVQHVSTHEVANTCSSCHLHSTSSHLCKAINYHIRAHDNNMHAEASPPLLGCVAWPCKGSPPPYLITARVLQPHIGHLKRLNLTWPMQESMWEPTTEPTDLTGLVSATPCLDELVLNLHDCELSYGNYLSLVKLLPQLQHLHLDTYCMQAQDVADAAAEAHRQVQAGERERPLIIYLPQCAHCDTRVSQCLLQI